MSDNWTNNTNQDFIDENHFISMVIKLNLHKKT